MDAGAGFAEQTGIPKKMIIREAVEEMAVSYGVGSQISQQAKVGL